MIHVQLEDLDQARPVSGHDIAFIFLQTALKEVVTLGGLLDPVLQPLRKELDDLTAESEN